MNPADKLGPMFEMEYKNKNYGKLNLKKRLLYLHSTPIDSEKANLIQVLYMCDSFSRVGMDVTLALPESGTEMESSAVAEYVKNKIGRTVNSSIVTFKKCNVLDKINVFGAYLGARAFLKENTFDFCMVRIPMFLELSLKQGIPTIFEAHNTLLHNRYPLLHKFWKSKLLALSKKRDMLLFIGISEALAKYWIGEGVPGKKVLSLHDGFDSLAYQNEIPVDSARDHLGIDKDTKVVSYTGSLYEDRGIETILKLAQYFPDVRFQVLGGPSERKTHFETLAREKGIGNIEFWGWVKREKVKEFLFASDILLMIWTRNVKTINFCSPLKMFEYMASGKIIVGHGFPTIKEVLEDGRDAFLANPDSFDDLRNKLDMALKKQCSPDMAAKARQLAFKKYSWDKRASAIIEFIMPGAQIKPAERS